jgi:RNA 2',3'-cyclic 3'-phosphodiesterase
LHPAYAGCAILKGLLMKKRIFIGIKINPSSELQIKIFELKSIFNEPDIKWVDLDDLHITLMFLGDVEESKLPDIIQKLATISRSIDSFEINLTGLGKFGKKERTNVIWVGIKNSSGLVELAQRIANSMVELGFEKENRAYSPHLTVGRVKTYCDEERIDIFIKQNKRVKLQLIPINEFILYESLLKSSGPKYKALGYFGF